MSKETVKIILGDEYDDATRDALLAVLVRSGAVDIDKTLAVGGSQEVETLVIKLGGDRITIEAETFVGLSITGPRAIVENISLLVRQQLRV